VIFGGVQVGRPKGLAERDGRGRSARPGPGQRARGTSARGTSAELLGPSPLRTLTKEAVNATRLNQTQALHTNDAVAVGWPRRNGAPTAAAPDVRELVPAGLA